MGVSKVEINNSDGTKNVLVDLTGDTVTANDLAEGITAHGADGEEITGTLKNVGDIVDYPYTYQTTKHSGSSVKFLDASTNVLKENLPARINLKSKFAETISQTSGKYIYDKSNKSNTISLAADASEFGDATAEDVAAGKTFTSSSGLKVTGTHTCASPSLQSKSVTPSESAQEITPDSDYDGLSSVSVGAISSTYVGSGVAKKSATTYTPGTSDQVIVSGQYLDGDQTIEGDANLAAENIKSGVSIFGVAGSYKGESSGGSGSDNCEAYHITDKSTALNFKRTDGDIKVWGYGYHSQSTYQKTTYAFVGDGYYTASSYGTPSKTSKTFGINSDGTLSGLPSNLTKVDLLVTKGI